jgi:hypothetical protein
MTRAGPSGATSADEVPDAARAVHLAIAADNIPEVVDQATPGDLSTWVHLPDYDHILDQWNTPPDTSHAAALSKFLCEATRMMMMMGIGNWGTR